MTTKTKTNDLKHLIELDERTAKAERDSRNLENAILGMDKGYIVRCVDDSLASRRTANEAGRKFAKIPAARRQQARVTKSKAEEMAMEAARRGQSYSGSTDYSVRWTDGDPVASTETSAGGRYSRSCTYRKTDATHIVRLSPDWTPLLIERENIAKLSALDGMELIGWHKDGRACWVKAKGKAIIAEQGYIAHFGTVLFHSTKTQADAERGLARKLSALRAEWHSQAEARANAARHKREERRARLVARLCNASATIGDALALGLCRPGIEAFQAQHNIGDSAPLRVLMSTGNPSAIRLAMVVARKVSQKNQPVLN